MEVFGLSSFTDNETVLKMDRFKINSDVITETHTSSFLRSQLGCAILL